MKQTSLFEMIQGGFFNDVTFEDSWWMGGTFDMRRLEELWRIFKGRPYAMKYNLKHHGIMPTWGVPAECETVEESEEIYKRCLGENITWEKAIGHKEPPANVLL